MSVKRKLSSEISKDAYIRKSLFWGFWTINALTTFLFGYEFLYPLTLPFTSALLPVGADTALVLASLTGGVFAILVLDVAYKGWNHVKLHLSETEEQFTTADRAEMVSFWLSISYTAVSLVITVFPDMATPALLNWLMWYGAGSFIFISCAHCWWTVKFQRESIAVRDMTTAVRVQGKKQSEKLAFQEKVQTSALLEAAASADEYVDQLSSVLGHEWSNELIGIFSDRPRIGERVTVDVESDEGQAEGQALGLPVRDDDDVAERPVVREVRPLTPEEFQGSPFMVNGHGRNRSNGHSG